MGKKLMAVEERPLPIQFRVPSSLHRRLKAWCAMNGTTLQDVLHKLVRQFVEENR